MVASVTVLELPTTEECCAADINTPRYIDETLEMKFADGRGGRPLTSKMFVRRFTGDSTPYTFPIRPITTTTKTTSWPDNPPFTERDFWRADSIDDSSFYAVPRFVYHIDEPAVSSLTQFYRKNIQPGSQILDICSSWVSHYPVEFVEKMERISGTGMNRYELQGNKQLNDFLVRDLNVEPILPYGDKMFDVVTCVVSIDYLIHPIEVLKEMRRVLKPGGKVIVSQSNRFFPSKAIRMWLKMDDMEHLELINGYFQYAGGFKPRKTYDITAKGPDDGSYNPMYVVVAEKA